MARLSREAVATSLRLMKKERVAELDECIKDLEVRRSDLYECTPLSLRHCIAVKLSQRGVDSEHARYLGEDFLVEGLTSYMEKRPPHWKQ